ncbi:MAG: hypothetical protein U0136_11020 [Bdellovibrionota bacterium]
MNLASFYDYKNYRWFWLNLALLVVLSVIYFNDDPLQGPGGDTLIGYTYGGIATAGILYLMWFGVRKRSYSSSVGTLQGWLSAHVWLGIALLFIVPLHSGFSFGMNVHTLAYALMVVVIMSGIWGALNYSTLASRIKSHRGGAPMKKLLSQLHLLDADINNLCKDKGDTFQSLYRQTDFRFKPSLTKALFANRPNQIEKSESSTLLAKLPEKEQSDGLKLISLMNKKRMLVSDVLEEVAILTKLRLWLFIHLPCSFALLTAVGIHIFSVFYYR